MKLDLNVKGKTVLVIPDVVRPEFKFGLDSGRPRIKFALVSSTNLRTRSAVAFSNP